MTTHNDNNRKRSVSLKSVLTPCAGAGMGVGVGAALTAATGDGWWIAGFAGFGAVVAIALNTLHSGASATGELTTAQRRLESCSGRKTR